MESVAIEINEEREKLNKDMPEQEDEEPTTFFGKIWDWIKHAVNKILGRTEEPVQQNRHWLIFLRQQGYQLLYAWERLLTLRGNAAQLLLNGAK